MRLALHWRILIALALGVLAGLAINQLWTGTTWLMLGVNAPSAWMSYASSTDPRVNADAGVAAWVVRFLVEANQFIADLFVRCLRFVAVPIVLFSLIAGTASLGNLKSLGRIGAKTLGLFLVATVVAIVVGLVAADVAGPGRGISEETRATLMAGRQEAVAARVGDVAKLPSLSQTFLEMVPRNPFDALARGDMLQVIVFAVVVGAGLTVLPRERAGPVAAFFDTLAQVMITAVHAIMAVAPIAVFCLITPVIARLGPDVLAALAGYCLLFAACLSVVLFGLYPLMLVGLAGYSPRKFYRGMLAAKLTALSTSSSSATLPVTIDCCRNNLGVSERVCAFVLPLGATVNMNGTAMYQAVAALFVAQLYGIELTLAQQASIVLTATLAAVGTPGVPSASLVFLVVILEGLRIPAEGIAVILGVDALLDRLRTVVNIAGDAVTAVIVARSEGELDQPAVPA